MQFATDYIEHLRTALAGVNATDIGTAVSWLKEARDNDRFVYMCGNGGSALVAMQMVVDLVKGASFNRAKRFKAISLTDLGTITAYANDVDYERVFVEPLRNFAGEGDVLIAISGSGNSPNVLRAVEYANGVGCRTIGLTQAGGGALKDLARLTLGVPSTHMGRLEDCFFALTHILMYAFMEQAVE